MTLVGSVVFAHYFCPLAVVGEECVGFFWRVINLGEAQSVSLIQESAIEAGSTNDIYIIGGASLYSGLLDKADRLCLTEIDDTPKEADTFFPDYSEWTEVMREHHRADKRHAYDYDFANYMRPSEKQ